MLGSGGAAPASRTGDAVASAFSIERPASWRWRRSSVADRLAATGRSVSVHPRRRRVPCHARRSSTDYAAAPRHRARRHDRRSRRGTGAGSRSAGVGRCAGWGADPEVRVKIRSFRLTARRGARARRAKWRDGVVANPRIVLGLPTGRRRSRCIDELVALYRAGARRLFTRARRSISTNSSVWPATMPPSYQPSCVGISSIT